MEFNQKYLNVTDLNQRLQHLEQLREISQTSNGTSRSKTALRKSYEAEVAAIKNKWGDLEAIRKSLGLSRRKICQFLMVDPSAWTRWTNGAGRVPPHIYRALELYLLLEKKGCAPELSATQVSVKEFERLKQDLTRRFKRLSESTGASQHYDNDIEHLQQESQRLKNLLEQREQVTLMWKFILLINCAVILYFILDSLL